MQTHFELSLTYTELYTLHRESRCSYICWSLQEAFIDRFGGSVPDNYDPYWVVNEDVAAMLYNKYREFVPKQDKWEISERPTLASHQMLIDQYGIMSMFSPHEINTILNGAIGDVDRIIEDIMPSEFNLSDAAMCKMFFDDCIDKTDVRDFRIHLLGVIASNDPNGIFTVSCDIQGETE